MATVRIDALHQVYNDGNHNAFTDLCRFQGRYYLTFRSCPDGHMLFSSSRIVVLSSADGQTWSFVHAFQVPDRDVRDPHFLVFQNNLFIYSGTWLVYPGEPRRMNMNEHLGYCIQSADGVTWQAPQVCEGTHGYLTRYVGGPLLTKWGARYLVGGRKVVDRSKPTTVLYWLNDGELEEILELPSGGDNSYPGFIELTPTQGLLSYYSSHEGSGTSLAPCHIYVAALTSEE